MRGLITVTRQRNVANLKHNNTFRFTVYSEFDEPVRIACVRPSRDVAPLCSGDVAGEDAALRGIRIGNHEGQHDVRWIGFYDSARIPSLALNAL